MSKKEAEKVPLLPTAKAVPVADPSVWQQPESHSMSRTIRAEAATIEDFMEEATDGLMIRERAYIAQILCGVCEKQTQFKVANFDPAVVPESQKTFTLLHGQLRPSTRTLGMHTALLLSPVQTPGAWRISRRWYHDVYGGSQWLARGNWPILVMEKPFKCPVVCCCFMPFPFEMQVKRPATSKRPAEYFGKTVCDWKW